MLAGSNGPITCEAHEKVGLMMAFIRTGNKTRRIIPEDILKGKAFVYPYVEEWRFQLFARL